MLSYIQMFFKRQEDGTLVVRPPTWGLEVLCSSPHRGNMKTYIDPLYKKKKKIRCSSNKYNQIIKLTIKIIHINYCFRFLFNNYY